MSRPVSPLSVDHWVKMQSALTRSLRGETVPRSELEFSEPSYDCRECQDTRFIVEIALDNTRRSRRCLACKSRFEASLKASTKGSTVEIPEDDPPEPRDWKKLAGFEHEED